MTGSTRGIARALRATCRAMMLAAGAAGAASAAAQARACPAVTASLEQRFAPT
jgi:hypothetical protein